MNNSNHWSRHFPVLPGCPADVSERLDQLAGSLFIRKQSELQGFQPGGRMLFLLTSGRVRVHDTNRPGPRIRYFRAGRDIAETVTNACLMAQFDARSRVVAETDVHAVTLDADAFTNLMIASPDFRALLHRLCGQRIANLLRQDTESRPKNHREPGTPTATQLV